MAHNTRLNVATTTGGDEVNDYDLTVGGPYPATGKVASCTLWVSPDASTPPTPVTGGHPLPVSASALPLPAGAATNAALLALGDTITGSFLATGQAVMGLSLPVTIASDQPALPVAAGLQTGQVLLGTTPLAVQYAFLNATASGATTVVVAVAGKTIRVLSYLVSTDAPVIVHFASSVAGAISANKALVANQVVSRSGDSLGHFETAAGQALQIVLSGAANVGVDLTYIEV